MQWLFVFVQSIDPLAILAHLLYSTPYVLWELILCIKLHLSSTIQHDGLLGCTKRSDPPNRSSIRSSDSAAQLNVDLLDTTLSSVNVG